MFKEEDIINLNTILWCVGRAIKDPRDCCGLVLMYGPGSNGKSTQIDTIQVALGDSCCATMNSWFMGRINSTISTDTISDLFGARVVIGADTDSSYGVNVKAIRILTGGDRVSYGGQKVKV